MLNWIICSIKYGMCTNAKAINHYVIPRAYRAAVGGERACNPRSANVDGEILIVTKNSKTFNE